jgi:hypothetical protein
MFANRRKIENELTRLLTSKGLDVELEEVLHHRELHTSLRSEVPELLNYILPTDPALGGHLPALLNAALNPTPAQLADPRFHKTSAFATKVLSAPSHQLWARLHKSQLMIDTMRNFPDTENGQNNPVFCGHFLEIFVAMVRQKIDILVNAFPHFIVKILSRINLLGYQELLSQLAVDHPDEFAAPATSTEGYRYIAGRAQHCADRLAESTDPADRDIWAAKLGGICSSLSHVCTDRPQSIQAMANDLIFIRLFRDAIFRNPVEEDAHLAFNRGISFLTQLIALGEEDTVAHKPIARFLREFARRFYTEKGVDKIQWETITDFTPTERMLIDAFPVLWQGGIDCMYPLFFRKNPVSSPFNQAMLLRLTRFSRVRLLVFLHDHQIFDRIAAVTDSKSDASPSLNPHLNAFAGYWATGKKKKAKKAEHDLPEGDDQPETPPDRPITPNPEWKDEYDRQSEFVVKHWLPQRGTIAEEHKKMEQYKH